VKQLVELQNGTINVVSQENEGSTFSFTIEYQLGKIEFFDETKLYKPKNNNQLKNASILLVEDNDINRLYASSILKMWGCHFETAENGVVALEKIRNNAFDIILMDIQMPVMDGFETTKAIRQGDPKHHKVPIIALTANATQKDFENCIAAGMNDCITKPFTQEDLFQTLTKYLGKKLTVKKKSLMDALPTHEASLVDLSYLRKVSNNNEQFIKEIVSAFLESMPSTISNIETQLVKKDWDQLARVVHKIKPTITLMGIHQLKDKIILLEKETKNGQDENTIQTLASEVSKFLTQAIESLRSQA